MEWKQFFPEIKEEELEQYFEKYALNFSDCESDGNEDNSLLCITDWDETLRQYGSEKCPFDNIVYRLIFSHLKKTKEILSGYSDILIVDECQKKVSQYYTEKILNLVIRTLIKDIQDCEKENILPGENSEQRYQYYNEIYSVSDEHMFELQNKYPALFRTVAKILDNLVGYLEELLANVKHEWKRIGKVIKEKNHGKIKTISFGKGDTHNGGKSVAEFEFECGELLYKPHNLDNEANWKKLIDFLNRDAGNPVLSAADVLACGKFGFMEKVVSDEVVPIEQYFRNLGGLLAVLYSVNATDCHFENIVIRDGFPVLVDAETLFTINPNEKADATDGIAKAIKALLYSVNQIGILPMKVLAGKDKVDVGASSADQEGNKVRVLKLKDLNSTSIHFEYEYVPMSNHNKPLISDKKNILDICEGFERIYNIILAKKKAYYSQVTELFSGCRVRVLYNPTAIYGNLLGISCHPCFMESMKNRERILSRIALTNKEKEKMVKNEIKSLLYNDVPYFTIGFDECSIRDCTGAVVDEVNSYSPKASFLKKINVFSANDLLLQKEMIIDSYYKFDYRDNLTGYSWEEKDCSDTKEETEIRKNIIEMLDYLYRARSFDGSDMLGKQNRCFVGSTILDMDKDIWIKKLVDFDFYDGHTGLAYLYMYAAKQLNEERYKDIANQIFNTIYSNFNLILSQKTVLTGVHKGIGGIILTLCDFKDDFFIDTHQLISSLLNIGYKSMDSNNYFDFIGGNIGFVLTAMYVSKKMNDPQISELVDKINNKYRDFLLKNTEKAYLEYSGYAHGLSSLIVLVYQLYIETKDMDILKLFTELLKYDRKVFFDVNNRDWYRSISDYNFSKGWCHGSPGILLGRIQLKKLGYTDEFIDDEIDCLKGNVKSKCFGNNLSFCHGDAGNLAIVLLSDTDEKHKERNRKLWCSQVIDSWKQFDKPVYKLDGIMAGFGGVIYALINNITGDRIPSFISLV